MLIHIITIVTIFLFSNIAYADQYEGQTSYTLSVSFDIKDSKIRGISGVHVPAKRDLTFQTGDLYIKEVYLNEKPITFTLENGVLKITTPHDGNLEIRYEGQFRETPKYDKYYNLISDRGIYLTGIWYPRLEGIYIYNLKAFLPNEYEALSEAEKIEKTIKDKETEFIFIYPYPVEKINLIASERHRILKDKHNDTELYAYFTNEHSDLATSYIEHVKKYLAFYEPLFGKYPFKRFSVVENLISTEHSAPTYILLNPETIRLTSEKERVLGREIVRQWFGNLIYVNEKEGNWSEGLAIYLSELLKLKKEDAWEYRKQILINYGIYVDENKAISLKDFKEDVDLATRAVGHGKGTMFFHMLKNIVGEDNFYNSLMDLLIEKRFQRVSWQDIKNVFEKNCKTTLNKFFEEWINEPKILNISIDNPSVKAVGSNFVISFEAVQKDKTYSIDIPVTIYYLNGTRTSEVLKLNEEKQEVKFVMNEEPERLVVDENYDTVRILDEEEIPPVIAMLQESENLVVILPQSQGEIYTDIIRYFKEKNALIKESKEIKDSDIKSSSFIILGNDNPLINRLFGKPETINAGFSLRVKKNPWNFKKAIGIINATSKKEADAGFGNISQYNMYSFVAFKNGEIVSKDLEKSKRGIEIGLMKQPLFLTTSAIKTLPELFENIAEKKIIYISESHDRFSHHNVQLKIIKELYKRNKKLAIGMEMFQRPFQNVIDEYIYDILSEKEFLKKSEYFKRWGYDYNLYKPILDFAKTEKIPVIALNARKEITAKVSSEGIDSLSDEEKKELPDQMDFSNYEYKKMLKDIFLQHRGMQSRNFDFFYQSQILWDETMSMSIDEFMQKNPDYQMVVIAGSGHIMYGYGIPNRTFRRNGMEYSIIINDPEIDNRISNYSVFPPTLEGTTAPKLMVMLKETDNRVLIEGFPSDSISEAAGLKEGDIIISLDGVPVTNIDDIKIHLFYKNRGDKVKVKVLRRRFLLGEKEQEFEIVL